MTTTWPAARPTRKTLRTNGGVPQVVVRRLRSEPVVAAGAVPGYGPIFNAGVVHHDGLFHLFARGVRDGYVRNPRPEPGPRFLNYISDILVFTSADGLDYGFQQVLALSSPEGVNCYEDPRVQLVRAAAGEQFVMTYTNLPADPGKPWRVGVHRLAYADGRFALNRTSGRVIGPEHTPDKDAIVFNLSDGRVALIHRIHPNMQLALFDTLEELWSSGDDYWDEHLRDLERHTIITPSPGALGIGAGAPPVETPDGLLLFYHEREASRQYTMRAALLDHATGRVKAQLAEPLLRPELPWERTGDVDDVVFVQGAVPRGDGTIYLTYGAADRCIGAASVSQSDVLAALRAAA